MEIMGTYATNGAYETNRTHERKALISLIGPMRPIFPMQALWPKRNPGGIPRIAVKWAFYQDLRRLARANVAFSPRRRLFRGRP